MKHFKKDFRVALKVGISVVLLLLITAFIHYYIIPNDNLSSLVVSTFIAGVLWFYVRKELNLLTVWG